jgi:hypothetical protein
VEKKNARSMPSMEGEKRKKLDKGQPTFPAGGRLQADETNQKPNKAKTS